MPDAQKQALKQNLMRVYRIMGAMGLTSGMEKGQLSPGDETAFSATTGFDPIDLEESLDKWEKANFIQNMVGKIFAKNLINQQNMDKYLGRVKDLRANNIKYLQPRGGYELYDFQKKRINEIDQSYGNIENILSNPATLTRLKNLFGQINRPSDIDRIPIENVKSRMIY